MNISEYMRKIHSHILQMIFAITYIELCCHKIVISIYMSKTKTWWIGRFLMRRRTTYNMHIMRIAGIQMKMLHKVAAFFWWLLAERIFRMHGARRGAFCILRCMPGCWSASRYILVECDIAYFIMIYDVEWKIAAKAKKSKSKGSHTYTLNKIKNATMPLLGAIFYMAESTTEPL